MPVELHYYNIGPNGARLNNNTLPTYLKRCNTLAANLANETGPYGFYPFVLTPAFTNAGKLDIQLAFMKACEVSQTCVTIGAVSGEPDQYICPRGATDCLEGTRRFKFGFSNFVDPTYDFKDHVTLFRQQGIRSAAFIFDSVGYTSATYKQTLRLAEQTGIKAVMKLQIGRTGLLKDMGRTVADVADEIIAANPKGMIIQTSVGQKSADEVAAILLELKRRGWWPEALSFGGGVDNSFRGNKILSNDDLMFSYGLNPWSQRFKDAAYHAVNDGAANFELFGSTDDDDSPAVLGKALTDRFYGGKEPADFVSAFVFSGAIMGALHMCQKLVEASLVDHAPSMVQAAVGLSAPSPWRRIQFDTFGRLIVQDVAIYQNLPNGVRALIYPPNIGVNPIYPIPSWKERVASYDYVSETSEIAMLTVNAVVLVYVLAWVGFTATYWSHRVIRAATPSFCFLVLMGCACMIISNFFATLQSSNSRCAAFDWLLTIGFTLTFAPLFIKTDRIRRIFSPTTLTVQHLPTSHLALQLGALVLVDIIVNAVWQGTGNQDVQLNVPDVWRPSLNYITCHVTGSKPYLLFHVVEKGILIIAGMYATWAVRHVPNEFNESLYITVCIYNVALVSVFVIPLVTSEAGGRETGMQIQAYSLMFISFATSSLLFIPKLIAIRGGSSAAPLNVTHFGQETPSLPDKSLPDGSAVAAVGKSRENQLKYSKAPSGGADAVRNTPPQTPKLFVDAQMQNQQEGGAPGCGTPSKRTTTRHAVGASTIQLAPVRIAYGDSNAGSQLNTPGASPIESPQESPVAHPVQVPGATDE